MIPTLLGLGFVAVMPFLMIGVINRTKALWSGRRGPPLAQSLFDVLRLLRKTSVYSVTTTPVFRVAPWVFLFTALATAVVTPLTGTGSLARFEFDFVWFAYAWALGRVAIMLAGLDTGSAFEGMGVSREATFSTLLEPALFLVTGALSLATGKHALSEVLVLHPTSGGGPAVVWVCAVVTLLVVLQVETARMPVDDPTTHLELTMVHEVMVLDHSGPDLAAIQLGSALKLSVGAAIVATLVNPWAGTPGALAPLVNVALCLGVAVTLGTVESLIARFKLRAVPAYILSAVVLASVALLATAWRVGGVS